MGERIRTAILLVVVAVVGFWVAAAASFEVRHPKANRFAPYAHPYETITFDTVEGLK